MAQIEAPAGMETKIKVTPTYRSSSYDIKILNPEERHCRFLDEVKVPKQIVSGIICFKINISLFFEKEISMFKYYRKEGCLYECRIKYASQKAGCIPWDYPTMKNMNDSSICTSHKGALEEFEIHMQNDDALANCNCEPNCEEVAYKTEVKLYAVF